MKNIFSIDGIDGIGKTTIAKAVCERTGYNYQKFPNPDTYIGHTIRDILQGKRNYEPLSFQALNCIDKRITELKSNIIIDRYLFSQKAYGLLDGIPLHVLNKMNYILPEPTCSFIFMGTPFRGDKELFGDRQEQVSKIYEDLLATNIWNKKVVRINANKPFEDTVTELCDWIWKLEV